MTSTMSACTRALLATFFLSLPARAVNAEVTRTFSLHNHATAAPNGASPYLTPGAQHVAVSAVPRWVNISPPQVSTNPNKPVNNYGFQALAIDPTHTKTLYVGTCYQGLWKTNDGGRTWFKVNTGVNGALLDTGRLWSLAVDPFDPQTIYLANGYGDEQGVWKSTDGGVDWQQMLPATSPVAQQTSRDVLEIATDPYKRGHILVAFHGPWGNLAHPSIAGILESKDGGKTWAIHRPQRNWTGVGETSHYIAFLNNSSTWLFERADGFWRTTNSGKTWIRVSSIEGGAGIYRAMDGVWYAGAKGSLLRSTDDGRSWAIVGPGTSTEYFAVIGDGKYMYIQQAQTYDATPPTHYYYAQESSGTTWARYNGQTFSNGPVSMAYDYINHIVYSSNSRAGVWKLQSPSSLPATQ